MIGRALRTRSGRTRKATALTLTGVVALTVGLLATLAPPGAAQGQSVSTSTLPEAGVLRLKTGTQNHFRFEPTTGTALTQTWTSPGCKVNLASSPSLVGLSSTPNRSYPGFFGGSLGVGSNSEGNGQPCGLIDPGQTLTLTLVQTAGSALVGKLIDYAELDIEGKFGATFKIEGYLGSTSILSETYSTTGPDSGPDSADGDNYRIRFPKTGKTTVNKLVISIVGTTGAVSLEGGSDGTAPCDGSDANSAGCADFSLGQSLDGGAGTTDSLFHLIEVDGLLDCGDTVESGGNGTPANELTRLDNADGSTCQLIPYNLDSSTEECPEGSLQCILLQKDLLGQVAQFYWTVTWVPEPGQYQETETEFDFGDGFRPLQQCLQDANDDGFPELPPSDPDDPGSAKDPWCVTFTSADFDPITGLTTVKETYYGFGDPTGKR